MSLMFGSELVVMYFVWVLFVFRCDSLISVIIISSMIMVLKSVFSFVVMGRF